MNIKIDTRAFERAFNLYRKARVGKDYAYLCNRAVANVAARVIAPTPKANASRIRYELGQMGREVRVLSATTKAGKLRKRRISKGKVLWSKEALAGRIINKRLVKAGKKPIWGSDLEQAMEKMVAARIRAIGFMKSGWIPAAIKATRAVGQRLPKLEAQIRGREKGYAELAPKGLAKCFAEIGNQIRGVARIGAAALQKTVNEVARDMEQWAIKRLKDSARQSGIRVL